MNFAKFFSKLQRIITQSTHQFELYFIIPQNTTALKQIYRKNRIKADYSWHYLISFDNSKRKKYIEFSQLPFKKTFTCIIIIWDSFIKYCINFLKHNEFLCNLLQVQNDIDDLKFRWQRVTQNTFRKGQISIINSITGKEQKMQMHNKGISEASAIISEIFKKLLW